MPRCFLIHPLAVLFLLGCGTNTKYVVIERTQTLTPNAVEGPHTEVHYVLLHDGHKIYADCDVTTVDHMDPNASCGFRPLHSYDCEIQSDSIVKAKMPMSDLKYKDADGRCMWLRKSDRSGGAQLGTMPAFAGHESWSWLEFLS